jgi:hypothetical protein
VAPQGATLCHGLKAKHGRKYLWLDLYELASRLRQPDTIVKVRYFTTIVAGEPEAARRQETYLAALTALRTQVEVVRGKFKVKRFRCYRCGERYSCECDPAREYRTYEEKLTDVALGMAMVKGRGSGVRRSVGLDNHGHRADAGYPGDGRLYRRPDKWR